MSSREQAQDAWVVIPAAGAGRRLGSQIPKQYLSVAGRALLAHTLAVFDRIERVRGIVVVISAQDQYWPQLGWQGDKPVYTVTGGTERCHSVDNALRSLRQSARDDDWVLVHDAARPCLTRQDVNKMFSLLDGHAVGGLLAAPVTDTLKQADAQGECVATIERADKWRALTPQMFRYAVLREALHRAIEHGVLVTDDAEAVERAGYRVRLVPGRADNIKVTSQEDLLLAEWLLQSRAANATGERLT